MPDEGPLSVSVPGAVGARGACRAQTYGTRRWPRSSRPRRISPNADSPSRGAGGRPAEQPHEALARRLEKIWFNGDRPLEMGERVVQKDLAATLREIGKNGSQAFYSGPIAQKFAAYMKSTGGLIDDEGPRVVQGRSRTHRST